MFWKKVLTKVAQRTHNPLANPIKSGKRLGPRDLHYKRSLYSAMDTLQCNDTLLQTKGKYNYNSKTKTEGLDF